MKNNQGVKKESSLSLGEFLGERNIAGEEYLQRDMPVNVDIQHPADNNHSIKKILFRLYFFNSHSCDWGGLVGSVKQNQPLFILTTPLYTHRQVDYFLSPKIFLPSFIPMPVSYIFSNGRSYQQGVGQLCKGMDERIAFNG